MTDSWTTTGPHPLQTLLTSSNALRRMSPQEPCADGAPVRLDCAFLVVAFSETIPGSDGRRRWKQVGRMTQPRCGAQTSKGRPCTKPAIMNSSLPLSLAQRVPSGANCGTGYLSKNRRGEEILHSFPSR